MSMLPYEEAVAQLVAAARPPREIEEVPLQAGRGRVLAVAQTSPHNVPFFDNSAMDGYAVRCADVPEAGTLLPVAQRIPAGAVGCTLLPGSAARIFTGAPIPAGADAVVMQESCSAQGEAVRINRRPAPGEHIRRAGDDIRADNLLLAAGLRLSHAHLGLAASVGLARLPVFRRLRVALFSTGNELADPGEVLRPGSIFNSNRYFLVSLLEQLGCLVTDAGTLPDRLEETRQALRGAAQDHHLILTSGGVSVGEEDHVKAAVEAEGELTLWKVAVKPGKPLAFGRIGEAAFIGLPGNSVASFVTFLTVVRPFILRSQGAQDIEPPAQEAEVDFDWTEAEPRRSFLRVRRGEQGRLALFPNQSSAVLTSTAWADGFASVPPGAILRRGDRVAYLPFSAYF